VEKVYQAMTSWWDPRGLNEAHNGYIEVYANLGWVGLGLIVFVLIGGYVRAAAAFFRNPPVGSLLLAYVVTAVVYSATEAGFRYLLPMWIFLLLSIVGASAVSAGYFDAATRQILTPRSTTPHEMSTGKGLKYPGPRYANYSPVAR
jgi:O-antigen ligase